MKLLANIALFFLLSVPCFAQDVLYVDIKKNTTDKINLIISSKMELEDKLSQNITETIKKNLSSCGLFNLKATDNDGLAIIDLNKISETKMKLSFRLLDSFTGEELVSKSMIFSKRNWREIAHSISDEIHSRFTGEKGHFSTKITYIAEEKDSNNKSIRKIAIMNRDGSNVKYLTNGDKFVSTPRFSPDGKSVIYVSYVDGVSHIMLRSLVNNNESTISTFEGVVSAPRFSPDGKTLLVSHSLDGKTNILSLDLKNKRTTKITKSSAINTSPSLSPDQKYMVFSSDISGSQQLYVIDLTKRDTKPKRISFGNGRYATPVWSPKGDLIAFTKIQSGKFYIGVMRPDGKEERILSEGHKIESPAWVPNGREIIFTKTESTNNSRLYLVDLAKKKHKLVFTPTNAFLPDWSYF
ncbi:MAG: protein TolB [Wolbachia endosymbiont of Tyrophagus putrescentiae]|nr:protein TolB [Wolbachia endosymbiont of Tyrophagus putrescentiae]